MCGVIGVCGIEIDLTQARSLLQLLVHRGQDASGLAWEQSKLHCLSKVKGQPITIPIETVTVTNVIGSTRYPTYGSRNGEVDVNRFAQPFSVDTELGKLSLCHNGQVTNIRQLTQQEYQSDAEFITVRLGELINETKDLKEASSKLLKELDGAFSIVGILGDSMFAIRDPRGIRPFVYGSIGYGYVFSSESIVLQQAGVKNTSDVPPGSLMVYSDKSLTIHHLIEEKRFPCMFEFVYFTSAASIIESRNVYTVRLELGRLLGEQLKQKGLKVDYVIPVPDTSKTASQTISEVLGIPLRDAILKNRTSLRTFIMPGEDDRIIAAKSKYLFIDELIIDKDILLVDDSIIRGFTLKFLIKLLRERGANSVHVAITNPPTRHPCYYGVDFTTTHELIAAKVKDIDQIAQEIGADSLTYLENDNLKKAIKLPNICMACIDGNYPTPFGKELHRLVEEGIILETASHYEIELSTRTSSISAGDEA